MKSFHGEFSKNLGYTFHVQMTETQEVKILLTPTAEHLFIQLNLQVFKISLLYPVQSLESAICRQEGEWIYIKVPVVGNFDHDLVFKRERESDIKQINCKKCDQTLVRGLEKTYDLPSTNWETLSEFWNCHPSHEQVYNVSKSGRNCYVSLFYLHFQQNSLDVQLENDGKELFCPACHEHVGIFGEEFSIFRHKVRTGDEESLQFLLKEAFIERVNELNRDLHLAGITVRLLSWNCWVFRKDRFVRAMKVLYSKSATPGIQLPQQDENFVKDLLRKMNRKLPENCRKFNDWRISFVLIDRS